MERAVSRHEKMGKACPNPNCNDKQSFKNCWIAISERKKKLLNKHWKKKKPSAKAVRVNVDTDTAAKFLLSAADGWYHVSLEDAVHAVPLGDYCSMRAPYRFH